VIEYFTLSIAIGIAMVIRDDAELRNIVSGIPFSFLPAALGEYEGKLALLMKTEAVIAPHG
jgi:hypothetical protein